jgi:hypothetical protein
VRSWIDRMIPPGERRIPDVPPLPQA